MARVHLLRVDIRQGRSSRILACPAGAGRVELGGRTELDGVRGVRGPDATPRA